MAIVDVVMPKMGESIMEATVLKWHKGIGDTVKMDETLLDIATDKVDSEVPSTGAGVIKELLYKENDVVPVGAVIARIEAGGAVAAAPAPQAAAPVQQAPAPVQQYAQPQAHPQHVAQNNGGGSRFYSPLVLNIASKDILDYIANKGTRTAAPQQQAAAPAAAPAQQAPAAQPAQAPAPVAPMVVSGNVEIIEMDRMRKLIADHMVRSKATSPHVTSFTEADVTNLVKWRDKNKNSFEKKYGEKITFTPIFFEAIVNCIRKYPMINCSLDGYNIILKKDINIGMATALPSGNLIVPVIKSAETKNLLGLTKEVNALANAARNGKLKADDTQGGTFTVTNVGTFGSLMGTPIINQPQVAILALGAIKKRPMVLETADGDVIAIRQMMYLSMSYDHRIVDGSLGASFLTAVAKELEAFDPNREV